MQWNHFVFLVVMSSTFIVSTSSNEPRNRRCLSIFTSLFSDDTGRTQRKQVNSHRKSSNNSNRKNNATLPKPPSSKGPKSGRQRAKNTEENVLTNFASDPFGAAFQTLGTNTLQAKSSPDKSDNRKSQRIQNLSGNRLTVSQEPIVTTTKENIETMNTENLVMNKLVYDSYNAYKPPMVQYMAIPQSFNMDQLVYDTYTHTVSPVIQYTNPIATLPRKYSYEQIKGETINKIALDNNSDVIIGESRLLRPVYEDDRTKDIIFSEHPYAYTSYPSFNSQQYEEARIEPNIPFVQRYGTFGMNIPNNDVSMYTGRPIIVMDDTSEVMKPSKLLQVNDINTVVEHSINERPRGDYKR